MFRRDVLASVAGGVTVAVAGCGGSPPEYQTLTPGSTEGTTVPPECEDAYREEACVTTVRARELKRTINEETDVRIQTAGTWSSTEGNPQARRAALSMVSDSTTTAGLVAEVETVANRFAAAVTQGWDVDRLDVEVVEERGATDARYRFYVKTEWAKSVNQGTISQREYVRRVVDTLGPVA